MAVTYHKGRKEGPERYKQRGCLLEEESRKEGCEGQPENHEFLWEVKLPISYMTESRTQRTFELDVQPERKHLRSIHLVSCLFPREDRSFTLKLSLSFQQVRF